MAALIEAASDPASRPRSSASSPTSAEAPGLTIAAARGIPTQVIARGDFADKQRA